MRKAGNSSIDRRSATAEGALAGGKGGGGALSIENLAISGFVFAGA